MSKFSPDTLQQYERTLVKDPGSKVFAPLADAYRELGRLKDAEKLARDGVERHPNYVGGYITLSRICLASQRREEAEKCLKKSIELSPENLLAYQLLGQCYLEMKRPHEALKAHKMVLFLNPLSEKSRQAVEKLETLTAVDYDDDLFEIRPLHESKNSIPVGSSQSGQMALESLERDLSFVDALIIRNELKRAREQLLEINSKFPNSPEVLRRWAYFDEDEGSPPGGEELRPLPGRERRIVDRKVHLLQSILGALHQKREVRRPLKLS